MNLNRTQVKSAMLEALNESALGRVCNAILEDRGGLEPDHEPQHPAGRQVVALFPQLLTELARVPRDTDSALQRLYVIAAAWVQDQKRDDV